MRRRKNNRSSGSMKIILYTLAFIALVVWGKDMFNYLKPKIKLDSIESPYDVQPLPKAVEQLLPTENISAHNISAGSDNNPLRGEEVSTSNHQVAMTSAEIKAQTANDKYPSDCHNVLGQIIAAANLRLSIYQGKPFSYELSSLEALSHDNFIKSQLEEIKPYSTNGTETLYELYGELKNIINHFNEAANNDKKFWHKLFSLTRSDGKEDNQLLTLIGENILLGNLPTALQEINQISSNDLQEQLNMLKKSLQVSLIARNVADNIFNYMSLMNYNQTSANFQPAPTVKEE